MEPKPYSHTDTDEVKAIAVFKNLIDSSFVKEHVDERSTTPNCDGYLELVNERSVPIGQLSVQIKKIPAGQTSYSCELELVAYSETVPALLLICVDISKNLVFWKQIYKSMPECKPNQKTFTIHFFQNSDVVDSTGIYLQKWREIVYKYHESLSKYPDLNIQAQNKLYLSDINPSDCAYFQRFIDTINNLLDNDFIAVKELLFPRQWKLGVSASSSDNKRLHYQIFTIPYGHPSPVITKLDKPFVFDRKFSSNTVSETIFGKEGKTEPIEMGKQFVFKEVAKIAEQKTFPIFGKVAQELLCTFIDLYHICLDLKPSLKQYTINEVDYAMNQYLFSISARSFEKVKRIVNDFYFVDLNLLSNYLSKNVPPPIDGKEGSPQFFLISSGFPIKLAFESLNLLKVQKIQNINRPFGLRDVDLSTLKGPLYIWSGYSPENEAASITSILRSSLEEYRIFVEGNRFRFPNSPYLDTKTSIIFEYEPATLNPVSNSPGLNEYHVVSHNLPKLNIFIKDTEGSRLDESRIHGDFSIQLDGVKYSLIQTSKGYAGFLFDRTPILNLVYRMLYSDLELHYGIKVHDRVSF